MPHKMIYMATEVVLVAILLSVPIVHSDDTIPADKSTLDSWFDEQVGKTSTSKEKNATLIAAEKNSSTITVRTGGGGDYETISDALASIPENNKNRVIIRIGRGNYTEKIMIKSSKPFVTFLGDPMHMPIIVYDGTTDKYGTTDSGTLIVEADHFSAVNIKVVNSAPRPHWTIKGAQAVALDVSGDAASFYNCRFYGFQDTLEDDYGRHFFKDCYIEGTVDFIFGKGRSIYLSTEIHVIPGEAQAFIAANARQNKDQPNGFIFAHCSITGSGQNAYLGRSWFDYARVIFAYSELSDVVTPEGWSNNGRQESNSTVYFGEYKNKGPGANLSKRATFAKKLTSSEAETLLTLEFLQGSTWLLPPAKAS